MLDAADDPRDQTLRRSRELDVVEPAGELPIDQAHFQVRDVGTQAEVLADPESDVAVGAPIDPEAIRLVEHLLVAVGGGIQQAQPW